MTVQIAGATAHTKKESLFSLTCIEHLFIYTITRKRDFDSVENERRADCGRVDVRRIQVVTHSAAANRRATYPTPNRAANPWTTDSILTRLSRSSLSGKIDAPDADQINGLNQVIPRNDPF